MTDRVSLEQLVHLSLGDPEIGAVNFNVLKTLLLQMLKAMNLFNYKPNMSDDDQRTLKEALSTSVNDELRIDIENDPSLNRTADDHHHHHHQQQQQQQQRSKRLLQANKRDRSSDRLNTLEEKVFRFESQLDALNQIPSNTELIDRAKQLPKQSIDRIDDTSTTGKHQHGPILEIWQYTQMEKRLESAENGITRVTIMNIVEFQ
jgi:hypothetical protein